MYDPTTVPLSCRIPEAVKRALDDRRRTSGETVDAIVERALVEHLQAGWSTLFQVSTAGALVEGVHEGAVSVHFLKRHGDLGLGTFTNLDGEMVVVDGHCHQVRSDGSVREVDDAERSPYAVLTRFNPDAPIALAASPRWGTAWCWPVAAREAVLPIDDSDMGCDCKIKCEITSPWTRQTAAIEIADADAITDDGQETWNLLTDRGIDNVILCGVHLNMCVLGRPFAIRQMTALGKNVALMRDMTDTMYNPERPPGVDHFAGTELVVEHVEQYWCPTFTSADLTGAPRFRFKDDPRAPR